MSAVPARPPASAVGRETALSRLVATFIVTGLLFMLVPGTLLGVLNLIQISGRESAALVAPAWLQAHGHAQLFGWIGSFMLGIGFYSLPAARTWRRSAWTCWVLWTTGVALRWTTNVYLADGDAWRVALPLSAAVELAAFLIFFRAVSHHRPAASAPARLDTWVRIVVAGTVGWLAVLIVNLIAVTTLAWRGSSPEVPHAFNQHFLSLVAWGVLAPFILGFSARWMPLLLGLRPLRPAALAWAVGASALGIALTFAGASLAAGAAFLAAAILAVAGLRMFEPPAHEPRTRGVHHRFPAFVRMAYGWLVVAALLGLAAARWDVSGGIWGASRHAFTVGFTAAMVFAVGQRMLPAFMGHHTLWSPRLMGVGLYLLMSGCALRVSAEVIAYQGYAPWAWPVLPVSAVVELAAVAAFAFNLLASLGASVPQATAMVAGPAGAGAGSAAAR